MSFSKNPAFNLKAVLQETRIAADTLRAWERRYGLPAPQRTAGGHRLYSQHDIEIIKWLIARQAEGLSISRAVDSWNERSASGADPLTAPASQGFPPPIQGSSETSLDALRDSWLEACLNFNENDAEQVLNQAFAIHPLEVVCVQVLQHGLSEIGMQWYLNHVSVQQEHFTSALAMRRLDALLSASPPPTRREVILVGCPPNEWHTFTPLLISLFLRRRGMNVIYLGANVPIQRFEETVKAVRADMVMLVAQQLTTAASLMETAQTLSTHGIAVAFGGRIFNLQPQLTRRVRGHYLGDSVESAIRQIESQAPAPAQNPQAEARTDEYTKAAAEFESRRPHIEVSLNQLIGSLDHAADTMQSAAEFLGDNIAAALQLGDITLVDGEIDWVKDLLKANQVPEPALNEFIRRYTEAVKLNINGSGKPITDWLARQ